MEAMQATITEYQFDEEMNQTVKSITIRTSIEDSNVAVTVTAPKPRYYVVGGMVFWLV